ncbi:hypothetical protein [Gaiella sp.]|uniref:hypothetical protein n=1 Tax=Gaiella sp. TaxID=2663207 RepID=UPI002E3474C3|nr:hypothetical protein [Gaiella sp.]HEX5582535.1 hypothetical protein [Gaiella sp.]
MSRRLLFGVFVAIPVIAVLAAWGWSMRGAALPDPLPAPTSPALPDLAMSPLSEIAVSEAVGGDQKYVSFTAAPANVGRGAFIVHAVRADRRGSWRVSQRFDEPDGSLSETITPGDVVWGGHGHNHWHVHMGASYWLTKPGSTRRLRTYEKVGFCFFDQRALLVQPPDAPSRPRFPVTSCNGRDVLEFTEGLSPGWSDPYSWALPDQRLDVTGLPDGVYRLWATADPGGWFRETNERNNLTWVDLRLTLTVSPPRLEIVRRGPAGASRGRG